MCDIYWLAETWELSRGGVRANEELVVHINESEGKTQEVSPKAYSAAQYHV